jgi:hypothetical protein
MASSELMTCFQAKSTKELLDIWQEHDRTTYREEVFEIIKQILLDRRCDLPWQKPIVDTNAPLNVLPEERRLPVSEYPEAWKEYNRRWHALLLGILASFIYLFFVINYMSLTRKGVFVPILSGLMNTASRKTIFALIAEIPILAIIMIFYVRFDSWPCPRCGISFKGLEDKMPVRADACSFCGLRRNAISDEPNASGEHKN